MTVTGVGPRLVSSGLGVTGLVGGATVAAAGLVGVVAATVGLIVVVADIPVRANVSLSPPTETKVAAALLKLSLPPLSKPLAYSMFF